MKERSVTMLREQIRILGGYLATSEEPDVEFIRVHSACIAQLCEIMLNREKTGGIGHALDIGGIRRSALQDGQ